MSDSVVALLKDLIEIPSVNPMGRPEDGPDFLEAGVTDYLENWFCQLGVDYRRMEVAPRRANIVARYAGDPAAPVILLDAHQDTVPVEGMTIPPFTAEERDGRMYGRGSCDVKGGLATMLTTFARVVRERPPGTGDVIMSCCCDEEHAMTGMRALAEQWQDSPGEDWLRRRPDVAIIGEPTSLDIVVAHKGVTRWRLVTAGRASHSSRPAEGVNAVYRMAEVLRHLQDYAAQLEQLPDPHPLVGPPTLSVGRIEGGISVNVVPAHCGIEIDRRVMPGEDQTTVIQRVADYLAERVDFEVEMQAPWCEVGSFPDDLNGALVDQLLQHVEAVDGPHQQRGVPFGTHAACTASVGVPSVVFGPGSVDQAHTKDEWIEIEQLHLAGDILFRFLSDTST